MYTNLQNVTATHAQQLADQYLAETFSPDFRATHGFYGNRRWFFLIQYQRATDGQPIGVGTKLVVDLEQGRIVPLTDEQIGEIREAPAIQAAQIQGELARGPDGYLLRYQAKLIATAYLREHLSLHYSATGGLFVPLPKALWQFAIRCHLGRSGDFAPLGLIDVDARTGAVIPLPPAHLQQIRSRVDAIVNHRTLATAA